MSIDRRTFILALGMRSNEQTVLGVWRIDGSAVTKVPWGFADAKLLYPTNLGIKVTVADRTLQVEFPRARMACLVTG